MMNQLNLFARAIGSNTGKIIQTLLSFFDLLRLSLIKDKDHLRYKEHQLINEEIDLNERL